MPIATADRDLAEFIVKLGLFYPAEILVLLATLALLAGLRVPRSVGWAVGLFAISAIVVRTFVRYPEGFDFRLFWRTGCVVWDGGDPYQDAKILNPPPAPTLYALFATLPEEIGLFVWTCLNLGGCCVFGVLAYKALAVQDENHAWRLPPSTVALLTGVLAFCYACRMELDAGQFAILSMVMILGAIWAQGRSHPWLAGAMLAVGAIKAAMWAPYLLLFTRKRDLPTWVSMAVVGLGLSVLTISPTELVPRCKECLANISTLSQPGRINDYMDMTWINTGLMMPQYALACCGMEDRWLIDTICRSLLVLLGLWLLERIVRKRVSRPAACALVSFYAAIFLYHRQYDMVLLAMPLIYVVERTQNEKSWTRWLYAISGIAILAVLYFRLPMLEWLQAKVQEGGVPRIVVALAMPYCVWCVLIGFAALAVAEHCKRRDQTRLL